MAFGSGKFPDLNVPPVVKPEVWRPIFQFTKDHPVTVNDTVMGDEATAVAVARGMIHPSDERAIANRSDTEAINEFMAFSIRATTLAANTARRLRARNYEVESLKKQIKLLMELFANSDREIKVLREENKQLKAMKDTNSIDLTSRISELERQKDQIQEQHEKLLAMVQKGKSLAP